jgi:CBS domain containing-hemolysin-like protein
VTVLVVAIVLLVVFGSVLAMAEASITRIGLARARALEHEAMRNAKLLLRIEEDPPRYLNTVYLSVMFAQNGSAVLVALAAERLFSNVGLTIASIVFTLLYFVLVEAMSKTFAVLHSDRVALMLSPVVIALSRLFAVPVRILIGLGNVLLPGKGLKEGPFASAEDIRQLAAVGEESGSIAPDETELIRSVLELGGTRAMDVMVPRPDMTVARADDPITAGAELMAETGHGRLPVYDQDPDNIVGVVYFREVIRALGEPDADRRTLREIARPPFFVPETVPIVAVLQEMQRTRVQMAIVSDEHGDVAGLLTLEDIVEEIVGDIADESGIETPPLVAVDERRWRVDAKLRVREFNELTDGDLSEDGEWNTIGGLLTATLAEIPDAGDEVTVGAYRLRVEQSDGRRIGTVLVERIGAGGERATG